jgi:transmembrane sensor
VLAELSRYRPGYLGCAPEVAGLRLSGTFLLDDSEAVLANLQDSLPVHVRRLTRYWVRIEAGAA